MKPMLFASALTGHIYVVTRYRKNKDIEGGFIADIKYDITDDFMHVMRQIRRRDWPYKYSSHEGEWEASLKPESSESPASGTGKSTAATAAEGGRGSSCPS